MVLERLRFGGGWLGCWKVVVRMGEEERSSLEEEDDYHLCSVTFPPTSF